MISTLGGMFHVDNDFVTWSLPARIAGKRRRRTRRGRLRAVAGVTEVLERFEGAKSYKKAFKRLQEARDSIARPSFTPVHIRQHHTFMIITCSYIKIDDTHLCFIEYHSTLHLPEGLAGAAPRRHGAPRGALRRALRRGDL